MIHETAGDILLTKAQAIAHGIAPNDHRSEEHTSELQSH